MIQRRKAANWFVLFVIVACLFMHNTSQAANLYVRDSFDSIQEAIDSANEWDTVIVRDGVYGIGRYGIGISKYITVRSENGPERCIIDGNGGGIGFGIAHSAPIKDKSGVEGFTIKNCEIGISCQYSAPLIKNCIIANNSGFASQAGGILIFGRSSPTIINCTITGNHASSWVYSGGGIYCEDSHPTIIGCTINGNTSDPKGMGGGGITFVHSTGTISDCISGGNSVGVGGGILAMDFSRLTIANCLIYGNKAARGGGIMLRGSSPTITNCTIVDNDKDGIRCLGYSNPVITNCIIQGNTHGIARPRHGKSRPAPVVTHSNVRGFDSGAGNIDLDPSFVDPVNGDFRLQKGSPCINAGYNDAKALPQTDLDGNPRIVDGVVDMGAYEFQ